MVTYRDDRDGRPWNRFHHIRHGPLIRAAGHQRVGGKWVGRQRLTRPGLDRKREKRPAAMQRPEEGDEKGSGHFQAEMSRTPRASEGTQTPENVLNISGSLFHHLPDSG